MSVKRYNFSHEKKMEIYLKTGGKCYYCNIQLENEDLLDWGGKVVTTRHHWNVDHKTPVSRNGTNDSDNLVPSCHSCNGLKGTRTAEEFMQQEQKYLQRRAR